MMRVKWTGPKDRDFFVDRLFGTGTMWRGDGDVQTVGDDAIAHRMCNSFPGMYSFVIDDAQPVADSRVPRQAPPPQVPTEPPKGNGAALDPTRERLLDSILIPDEAGAEATLPLRTASYQDVRRYVAALGISMRNPSRDQMIDVVIARARTAEEVEAAKQASGG